MDPEDPSGSRRAIDVAVQALRRGGVVVFPTDTVYGIAARPDDPAATGRLFEAKGRPRELSLPVLAPDTPSAWELVQENDTARRLAAAFWPGALTLVLSRAEASREWMLGGRKDTLAVRVPGDPLTQALLVRTGWLAATSANPSGRPPLDDPASLVAAFGSEVDVYLVLPEGRRPALGAPSTVVDLTGDAMSVLREGPIGPEQLRSALAES